jgi:hypothetical protein
MVLTEAFPCMILHRRNLACIGCGCSRNSSGAPPAACQSASPTTRMISSPRFVSSMAATQPSPTFASSPKQFRGSQLSQAPKPSVPSHPLLTPSGRAFAIGGKVQNVSQDPLTPCVMYWPDNEPLPDQGQIRPSGLTGMSVRSIFPGWFGTHSFYIASAYIKHW